MQRTFLSLVETSRPQIIDILPEESKEQNGQFMTPAIIAETMANMFSSFAGEHIQLLDPGAGAGSLSSAFLDMYLQKSPSDISLSVLAYEIDQNLVTQLSTLSEKVKDQRRQIYFEVVKGDFVLDIAKSLLQERKEQKTLKRFTHIIMNPPYRKLSSHSIHRKALRAIGIEANNFYSAFVALSVELLQEGGELVAITPRSFCNGPYFRSFRSYILQRCRFDRIHLFESRQSAFREEKVLQENIIFKLVKSPEKNSVLITKSYGRDFNNVEHRNLSHDRIIFPGDKEKIIHIPSNSFDDFVLERMHLFQHRLADLDLDVSTGPVVEFRVDEHIKEKWEPNNAPLIYPSHFVKNQVSWPQNGKKPNAIKVNENTRKWFMPNGNYVLLRRFSSKEEPRRIIPSLFISLDCQSSLIGFENHLNVIHSKREGLDLELAKGLTCYFASTLVDIYFRQFSGHTQVNASDLRSLPIPNLPLLLKLAQFYSKQINTCFVDDFIERYLVGNHDLSSPNPVKKYYSQAWYAG